MAQIGKQPEESDEMKHHNHESDNDVVLVTACHEKNAAGVDSTTLPRIEDIQLHDDGIDARHGQREKIEFTKGNLGQRAKSDSNLSEVSQMFEKEFSDEQSGNLQRCTDLLCKDSGAQFSGGFDFLRRDDFMPLAGRPRSSSRSSSVSLDTSLTGITEAEEEEEEYRIDSESMKPRRRSYSMEREDVQKRRDLELLKLRKRQAQSEMMGSDLSRSRSSSLPESKFELLVQRMGSRSPILPRPASRTSPLAAGSAGHPGRQTPPLRRSIDDASPSRGSPLANRPARSARESSFGN